MNIEQQWQEAFVHAITHATQPSSNGEALYQELLYYRFEEVFENAFVRFKAIVGDTTFSQLVRDFITKGCREPILWRCSGEFMDYVLQHGKTLPACASDLMQFEWTHITMLMHRYMHPSTKPFRLKKLYHLSSDVTLLTLRYPVHYQDFDENFAAYQPATYHLLCYADVVLQDIMVEEITPFLHQLLSRLHQPLQQQLEELAYAYDIAFNALLEVIEPTMVRFHQQGILIEP